MFVTAPALKKPTPSVTNTIKSRPGSFLRHASVSFLSDSLMRFLTVLGLVSDFHLPAAFSYQMVYDIPFSVSLISNSNLASQSRF